ncbi:MAG: glycoside hydrolase family 25 [Bacilli bacterium]|nr:glycoside hydrolase family 25 [Bacilli bacterium]
MAKKIKIFVGIFSFLILILVLLSVIYFMIKNKQIVVNKMLIQKDDIIGVDLSNHQGDVDMSKLKEKGIKFIYMKATEGSSHVDLQFENNWKNAKDEDILAGAYHFFSYDSSGENQANNFIKTVGDISGRLIPVVDVEYYGDKEKNPPLKEDLRRELKIYLDVLEQEYNVKPMIYTRVDIYVKYIKGEFDEYKKWISSIYYPLRYVYKDDWYLWQYTDRGLFDAYNGREKYIDLNVLNREKSLEDLIVY